jgi:hypothetical protein
VDVDNLDGVICSQMLTQLCDIHIHASRIEVVVIGPHCLERIITLQNLILMSAEQAEQLRLLCSELCLLVIYCKNLLLCVKGKLAYLV